MVSERLCRIRFSAILTCLAVVCLLSAGCRRSLEVQIVGRWNWQGCEDAGTIIYQSDHTFVSNDWALTYSQQPPILADGGDWKVRDKYLEIKFKGSTRPENARDLKLRFSMFDNDTMIVEGADGKVVVFTRAK